MKVKRGAASAIAALHIQMGPKVQALALSCTKDASQRQLLTATFKDHPYDPTLDSKDWPKKSIAAVSLSSSRHDEKSSPLNLIIPKMDLVSEIPHDCISRMVRFGNYFCKALSSPAHIDLCFCRDQRMAKPLGKLGRQPWKKLTQRLSAAVE